MTRAVRDRILKDANGDICDHLRNHIHLTNCIHLKNHIHKQSPILADRSLMRDLVVLQRSRSLKDPSMSPSSWQSPERDGNNQRSLGTDKQNQSRRLSGNSPVLGSSRNHERMRNKIEESVGKNFDFGSDDMEGDDVASSSHVPFHRKQAKNTRKWRKFKGSRPRRENQGENEVSVASNSFLSRGENETKNLTQDPRNGHGIPGNWSRIHNRGKSVSRGPVHQERDYSDMPVLSDRSNSSSKSQVEESPLLVDDADTAGNWEHDYSGELGIFADRLLKRNHHANRGSRHENLTQKYNPRSFRDLVGQNLVVQALTNAVAKRKIGLLYVFHGPNGTGKTSCARIFARALNCHSINHVKPCNICESCIANETGKSKYIQEVGPVSNFSFDKIMNLFESPVKQYRVFIFDDCDSFSPSCWNSISKIVDRAPKRLVFLLVSSSLDVLPHIIVSRCQRFFFPKLKDSDIIYTLQWIGSKEGLDIDKDALKLITSRSDGSLRDALMTLDQLTLLGQKISVPLVQELVGLISDEKLVDLLDLALSADTVNTVRNLREIMETGSEPLALMSQLATVITDILAGSYDYTKDRPRRKFFRRQSLSKQDMEKLRQALKTLSEAEKQLRMSTDRLTWLTAALLQLAPDQQYLLPSSSSNTDKAADVAAERTANVQASISSQEIEEIWFEVLDNIRINSVRDFMREEGKLISVSLGADPTVQLMFISHLAKSRAEKFKKHILEGFEAVLGSPLTIEIKYGSRNDERRRSNTGSSHDHPNLTALNNNRDDLTRSRPSNVSSEIVEVEATPVVSRISHRKTSTTVKSPCKSIVKSKVSLAHVIQQAEGWSKLRNFSMAEKLEHENLRLEPRTRSLLCWKTSRTTRCKISRLRIRTRKPHALLKYVSCGKCLMTRSPRQ